MNFDGQAARRRARVTKSEENAESYVVRANYGIDRRRTRNIRYTASAAAIT